MVGELALAVGSAFEGVVMEDHELTVAGELDVELNIIGITFKCSFKGIGSIFRRNGRTAAVSGDLRPGEDAGVKQDITLIYGAEERNTCHDRGDDDGRDEDSLLGLVHFFAAAVGQGDLLIGAVCEEASGEPAHHSRGGEKRRNCGKNVECVAQHSQRSVVSEAGF